MNLRADLKRTAPAMLILGLLALSAFAQDETPVFRTETTLVEFTLIAIDKDGNPVTDLKKEEIVVKEKGNPRDLALFRYEGGEEPQPTSIELPVGSFTNSPRLTPGAPRNITAIVLDSLNTPSREQRWVKEQVMRYLGTLLPNSNTRLGVYLLGQNLSVLHDFTDNAESLEASIEQVQAKLAAPSLGAVNDMGRDLVNQIALMERQGIPANTITALIQAERLAHQSSDEQRTRTTLNLLEGLGDHLAGVPGRKSIMWFGNGISMMTITGSLEKNTVGGSTSYEELVRDAARRLAQQGITMYMFDARGLQADVNFSAEAHKAAIGAQFLRLTANAAMSADPTSAMSKITGITGGRFYWNTNDVGRAVDEVAADSLGSYSLGFYADGEPDQKWHNLDVSVARKGVKLKYRDGYSKLAPPDAPLEWTDIQWRDAVFNPVGSTAVRLDARFQLNGGPNAETVSMVLQISTDDLHFRQFDRQYSAAVDLAIVDKLPNARYRMQRGPREIAFPQGETASLGVTTLRHTWKLTPGATVVRLMVRDRLNGRYGTLDVPVKDIPRAQSATP